MKKEYVFLILMLSVFAIAVCAIGSSVIRTSPVDTAAEFIPQHTTKGESTSSPPTSDDTVTDRVTDTEPAVTGSDPPETTEQQQPDLTPGTLKTEGGYAPSDAVINMFNDAAERFGRQIGVIAVDTVTGMTVTYNADVSFEPASIIKAVFALYCIKQIDAGEASLDEILTYTEDDYVIGNGTIAKMGFGTELTLYDVLRHVILTSDNEGYYMLLRRFDRSGCDAMTSALGCSTGKVAPARWPLITPRDYALVWQEIFRYKDESENGMMLYEMLMDVEYMHFFRDALGCEVANKSGWNDESYNEGGVVYGDRVYILVVLTSGSYYTADKDGFNSIVRAVDAMMSEYNDQTEQ